jgi:hypothetical protein
VKSLLLQQGVNSIGQVPAFALRRVRAGMI